MNELRIFSDPDAVAEESARRFAARMHAKNGEPFSIAISGGSTPLRFFRLLAKDPWKSQIDWSHLHVFFADERFVPEDHPDSNYKMAKETWLDHVPIPTRQIHPMPTSSGTPDSSALAYASELREFFGEATPAFDLIVLGMGSDGHTASLFPERSWPEDEWVIGVVDSPKSPPCRISLNLGLLNQAKAVLFLVTGRDKAEALHQIWHDPKPERPLPAARVRLKNGQVTWLLDEAAASLL